MIRYRKARVRRWRYRWFQWRLRKVRLADRIKTSQIGRMGTEDE